MTEDMELLPGSKGYHIYESLVLSGVTTITDIARQTHIKRPTVYVQIEQQKKDFDALSNAYQEHRAKWGRPRVQVYEGHQRINQLYEEITEAHSIRAWFNVDATLDYAAFDMAAKVRERKINMKDIISEGKGAVAYSKKMQRLMGPTYSCRMTSSSEIANDTVIYGNCVAIFRIH